MSTSLQRLVRTEVGVLRQRRKLRPGGGEQRAVVFHRVDELRATWSKASAHIHAAGSHNSFNPPRGANPSRLGA